MGSNIEFDAPWALSLKLVTLFSVGILGGMAVIGLAAGPVHIPIWPLVMVVMPLAILIIAAFFMIRGYELSKRTLVVKRLGWKTTLGLEGLQSAEADPDAMKSSWRTFGNGGLFCFAGKFRNKKLGPYRAFATDPKLSVVLRFAEKVIVVTPDNPKKFVARIEGLR